MRVAFVGKGGSGKTTLASLFVQHLGAQGLPVLGVDADINQHLGAALGLDERLTDAIPPIGHEAGEVCEYFRGDNPRIVPGAMMKTTPPGAGSRLVSLLGNDPIHERFAYRTGGGIRVMRTGAFNEADLGVACYHGKTGAVETYLGHLLDGPGEYVVVDMTAGADAFASGLCAKFDVTFVVTQPSLKSVSVYRQYKKYADEFGIRVCAVGNKVYDDSDVAFLQDSLGVDLATWAPSSGYVRSVDRGIPVPFERAEPALHEVLAHLQGIVDDTPQDWAHRQELAHLFHERNAEAWANQKYGQELRDQIDPDFKLDPALLAA